MSTFRVFRRQRYTTIDRRAVNDDRLSYKARGVLLWLLDKPDDWRCDATDIARASTDGRFAVLAALKELEEAGYLRRSKFQNEKGHWQTVTSVFETPEAAEAWETEAWETEVGKPDVGSPDIGEPDSLIKTETDDCDRTPVVPKGDERTEAFLDEVFGLFWEAYPRKEGKPRARAALKRILKANAVNPVEIGNGLTRWKAYWEERNEPQYIPHPTTWLNGEQWNDIPPAINGRKISTGTSALLRLIGEKQ